MSSPVASAKVLAALSPELRDAMSQSLAATGEKLLYEVKIRMFKGNDAASRYQEQIKVEGNRQPLGLGDESILLESKLLGISTYRGVVRKDDFVYVVEAPMHPNLWEGGVVIGDEVAGYIKKLLEFALKQNQTTPPPPPW